MVNISLLNLRVIKEKSARYDTQKRITSPDSVYNLVNTVLELSDRAEENLILLCLDTKNNVNGIYTVSTGSLSASIIHPREVFKRALLSNSAAIILVHNHPSGDTTPSKEDIEVTNRISEAGKILGIELLDHLIVGDNYISLKERGII